MPTSPPADRPANALTRLEVLETLVLADRLAGSGAERALLQAALARLSAELLDAGLSSPGELLHLHQRMRARLAGALALAGVGAFDTR
jgi:hypothetical protein